MTAIFENDQGKVDYDSEGRCVTLTFDGFLQGPDYRELLSKGLEVARTNGSSRWLADMRTASVMNPTDIEWINEVWIPDAWAAGIRFISMAVPKNVIAAMQLKRVVEDEEKPAEQTIFTDTTRYFAELSEARSWLLEQDVAATAAVE